MHTTDTHGFTESLWGLCYLLGIDFMPRLKDLVDQRLWRSNDSQIPDLLADLFAGNADVGVIIEQWDQLVRIAASLKARTQGQQALHFRKPQRWHFRSEFVLKPVRRTATPYALLA